MLHARKLGIALPTSASVALIIAGCGSGGGEVTAATSEASGSVASATSAPSGKDGSTRPPTNPKRIGLSSHRQESAAVAGDADVAKGTPRGTVREAQPAVPRATPQGREARTPSRGKTVDAPITDAQRYKDSGGATDTGITKTSIKVGMINMHGMAFSNLVVTPIVRGTLATASAINDRGGVLGRRINIVDCDDGPGEVSRAKSCLRRLVYQDRIFSLVSGADWATASLHDDLKLANLPHVGSWGYSQTEWQDPFMFPTHMSMLHEALAGAYWVRDVIKPKTYGLLCLTSPEMQAACANVAQVLDKSGVKLVRKVDVGVGETSLSSQVLSMRTASPDHIIHYVINPATIGKFLIEAAQQQYYPPSGMSGNHLMSEILGSALGKWPAGRYWTNTTYRIWGPEYMAVMQRYARGNAGYNHHIVQAGYVGVNFFAQAAREVGPNLTRSRLMAALANASVWKTDASLDQKFSYAPTERRGENWKQDYAQGREFMYKYMSADTRANPDGSASGFVPDPDKFVIYARE